MPSLMNDRNQPSSAHAAAEALTKPDAVNTAFSEWYAANAQWLVTQPFTEYVAAAGFKAGAAIAAQTAPALEHIYAGYCPDKLDPAARDPECPACRQLMAAAQTAPDAVPLFWYRPCRDGLYEGPHHHNSVGGRMLRDEKPGEWVPLYAGAAPVAQQAAALTDAQRERADALLDGFDSRIETATMNGDAYDAGYLKAMRAKFCELLDVAGIPAPTTDTTGEQQR